MTVRVSLKGDKQLMARLRAIGDTKIMLREVGLAAVAVGLLYFLMVILPWARSHRA
mgnify:CR=1 FL=1